MSADPIQVFIPHGLQALTGGQTIVQVELSDLERAEGASMAASSPTRYTVRDVIDELDRRFPGVRASLCAGDRLQPGLVVSTDQRVCARGLRESIEGVRELHFLPGLGGG